MRIGSKCCLYQGGYGTRTIGTKKNGQGVRVDSSREQTAQRTTKRCIGSVGSRANWRRKITLPWREAGPPNHLDDEVDSNQ